MSKKFTPKSRETIEEAVDIIRNTEDDEAAVAFLKDTLEDDYPELDLGRMDLHEAITVLGGSDEGEKGKKGDKKRIEELSKSLGDFMKKQNSNQKKRKKRSRRKRKRKK